MLKMYVKAKTLLWSLRKDIEGATMIEYSLLIGLITVAMVGSLVVVGSFVTNQWSDLALNPEVAAGAL